ncbi:MAG: YtxH domain-containing protein [Elusimicrobiota bacterium]
MSENNSGEVILAFLLGGIIGAAAGILYAPKTGKETREKLRDLAGDLGGKIEHFGEEMKSKAEGIVSEGKEKVVAQKQRIESAFEAGKKAYENKA